MLVIQYHTLHKRIKIDIIEVLNEGCRNFNQNFGFNEYYIMRKIMKNIS